jgi:hypothetical protein
VFDLVVAEEKRRGNEQRQAVLLLLLISLHALSRTLDIMEGASGQKLKTCSIIENF